ncbi:MAG: ABC transporter permease [Acidobacteriota bacterium]
MGTYLLRRLLVALSSLAGITVVTFALAHLAPGEPLPGAVDAQRPADPQTVHALRQRYGLDRPLPRQYADWVARVIRLDFGRSFVDHRPVRDKILERLPRTLALNLVSLLLIAVIAIPLGVASAAHRDGPLDRIGGPILYALYSLPSFWVALLLQAGLAVGLGFFPLAGLHSDSASGWPFIWRWADAAWHMALPALCLSYGSLAFFARFSRASLLEALAADFTRTARARGLPPGRVVWRHALGASWLPFLTLSGLLLPTLVSGSVIIERIFAWPGIGTLLFDSLLARDYPTILGLSGLTAILVLAGTLGADLLYLLADPRLRRSADVP